MGTPSSSAEGARIEVPKAPRGGVWQGGMVPLPTGEGSRDPEKVFDLGSQISEFWCKLTAFVQFT